MSVIEKPNVVDLCRLCLTRDETLIPVFDSFQISQILCDKIKECLAVKISTQDRVSQQICGSCLIKVDTFYEFKSVTSEAQRVLEGWLHDLDSALIDINSKAPEVHSEKVTDGDCSLENSSEDDGSEKESESSEEASSCGESEQFVAEQRAEQIQNDVINVILPVAESAGPSGLQSSDAFLELHCSNASHHNHNEGGKNKEQFEFAERETDIVANDFNELDLCYTVSWNHDSNNIIQNTADSLVDKGENNTGPSPVIDHAQTPKNHTEIKGKQKFKCGFCKFTAKYKSQLAIHVKRHRKDYSIFCKICHRGFFYQHEMEMHEAAHKEEKRFECSVCQKKFVYRHTLVAHMRKHDSSSNSIDCEKEKYECETCGKTFRNKSYLRKHKHIHSGINRVICDVCGLVLSSSDVLKSHQRTHTGERPYSCSLCGRAFNTKKYMGVHMRIHSGVKPFQCQVCGKAFSQQSTLTVHRRYHSGERPYECHLCKKAFVTKTILKIHQQKHSC